MERRSIRRQIPLRSIEPMVVSFPERPGNLPKEGGQEIPQSTGARRRSGPPGAGDSERLDSIIENRHQLAFGITLSAAK
jgi:hypothetical protein